MKTNDLHRIGDVSQEDLEANANEAYVNDDSPQDKITSKNIFDRQKRHNWQSCSPLGDCSDAMTGMTEEVENEALSGVKKDKEEEK